MSQSDGNTTEKVLIMANDHQRLLEAILRGKNILQVSIMANDHQHVLNTTIIYYNDDNIIKNHKACAIEGHSKRLSYCVTCQRL